MKAKSAIVEAVVGEWRNRSAPRAAHGTREIGSTLASTVIATRASAGLTQLQLAERMRTTQAVIARIESGRSKPSTRTLERLAAATGTRLCISFEAV